MQPTVLKANLFSSAGDTQGKEWIESLLDRPNIRIERIVSSGQISPDGFWYDQPEDEWVVLLSGSARLEFEDATLELEPGDHLLIPAHCKHRVAWTDPNRESVWLAVFIKSA